MKQSLILFVLVTLLYSVHLSPELRIAENSTSECRSFLNDRGYTALHEDGTISTYSNRESLERGLSDSSIV
jgi:hypothetical protein